MKFEIMAKVERKGEEFIIPRFWVEADNAVLARSYARQITGNSIAISAIEVSAPASPATVAEQCETKVDKDVQRQYKCLTTHSQSTLLKTATKLGPQAVHTVAVVLNQCHQEEFYLFYWE